VLSLEADRDRRMPREMRQGFAADAMVIDSLRLKIRDLERRNEQLAFEIRCGAATQEIARNQIEEMQKLLDQEKVERDEVWRQLSAHKKAQAASQEMRQ
jgi:hypothetical protein